MHLFCKKSIFITIIFHCDYIVCIANNPIKYIFNNIQSYNTNYEKNVQTSLEKIKKNSDTNKKENK